MNRETKEFTAVTAKLFGSMAEAREHLCDCADVMYRNNGIDYTRDYKLKGKFDCRKCRGAGAHQACSECGATGMVPGSKVCGECGGTGRVPYVKRKVA